MACVETIRYRGGRDGIQSDEITDRLQDCRYFVYADTRINKIFVDKDIW